MSIQVGAVLRGRYLLLSVLGRGGMGEVFAARDLREGGDVAIKVVRRTVVDETMMARLEREATAARRIRSPFVPTVFEIDRTADGELFLVMQRLHGETLSQRLRDRGVLTWDEVRSLTDDVLQGLHDAHAAGVVHRDLKPGNIFLEPPDAQDSSGGPARIAAPASRERAMIVDFGVCKLDVEDDEHLTTTGELVGTIAYMAPEQIRGASKVDGRADIYALCALTFEALAGDLPHDGQGQVALIASKLEHPARRLHDLAKVPVPPGLDVLLAKGLARKPDARFTSAEDMLGAWRALGAPTVMPRVAGQGMAANPPTETGVTAGTMVLRGGSRVGLMLGALGILAAGAVLLLALSKRDNGAPTLSPTGSSAGAGVGSGESVPSKSSGDASPGAPETDAAEPMLELEDTADWSKPPRKPSFPRPKHTATTKPTTPPISTKPRY